MICAIFHATRSTIATLIVPGQEEVRPCAREPDGFKHHLSWATWGAQMAKADFGYEITVRVARDQDGRSHFAGPYSVREQLLRAALPALWALVAVVTVAVLVTTWN